MYFFKSNQLLNQLNNHSVKYPSPPNLNYFWGFGSLAGIYLVIQIVTGLLLSMHYTPQISLAFESIEHIMRDVNNGWLLRYLHANGASFFFIVVYLHISRGLYYSTFFGPKRKVWLAGLVIFLLMMATAFLGYVLPWGQMSFWGATVITNLFSAIPLCGQEIAQWLWGGFSVNNATLNRFFSLHYLLPFVIGVLVVVHIVLLHEFVGSYNPLKIKVKNDNVELYPYFILKDMVGFILLLLIFLIFVLYIPNYLGHSDNYIKANPMVTPTHIVPEWYFLPFYAILRSIPNKVLGVVAMGYAIVCLYLYSKIFKKIYKNINYVSGNFFEMNSFIFIFQLVIVILLGFIGGQPVEMPFFYLGQILSCIYLGLFNIIIIQITFNNLKKFILN